MAGLDDLYGTVSDAANEFSTNFNWNSTGETPQWDVTGGNGFDYKNPDDNNPSNSYTASNGFKVNAGQNGGTDFDFSREAQKYGYDWVDPRSTSQIAQKNFGGDPMAALKYRYGDDAQFVQDPRFAPYDVTGKGYFVKPTDASRLTPWNGIDYGRFPQWQMPDSQPGLVEGALSGGFPALQIAGFVGSGGLSVPGAALSRISGNPLAGQALNFATGNLGGGMNISSDDYASGLEDWDAAQGAAATGGGGDIPGFNAGDAGMSAIQYRFDPQTGQFAPTAPVSTTPNLQNAASPAAAFTGGAPSIGAPDLGASGPNAGSENPALTLTPGAPPAEGVTAPAGAGPGTEAPITTPAAGGPNMSLAPPAPNPFIPSTPTGTPVGGTDRGAPDKPEPPGIGQRAIDAVLKNPLGVAGLGVTALNQARANSNGKSAQAQLQNNAAPAAEASKQLIQQGLSGTVPPTILAQFDRSAAQQKEAIKGRYARMGRDPNNDSSAAAEMAKVDADRDAQVANYASTLLNQGLAAAGVANGPQTAAVTAGVQSDKALSDSMSAALQNYNLLQMMQRGEQPAVKP